MTISRFFDPTCDEIPESIKFSDDIDREYRRWIAEIGDEDPYVSPVTVGIYDVLRAHFVIVDFFSEEGEGVGGIGPKSLSLLHSAIGRQHTTFGGYQKWNDKFEIAATLMYGLIKNHPFHDANKRTAFLSTLYMLQKNGRCLTIPATEFEEFTVLIAEKGYVRKSRYKQLSKKQEDPEIKYIAYYLKKSTRQIDKRDYIVTFRELRSILNTFSFDLINPSGNYIDVVKREEQKSLLIRTISGKTEKITRLAQIGFPGWTKQVNTSAISTVRRATKLTHEYGYDSQTFFKGVDDMKSLLNEYQEVLRRLAFR